MIIGRLRAIRVPRRPRMVRRRHVLRGILGGHKRWPPARRQRRPDVWAT